jgi:hypothetical protein
MSNPLDLLFDGVAHYEEHVNPSVHKTQQASLQAIEAAVTAFEATGSAPPEARFFAERLGRLVGAMDPHRKTVQALVERLTPLLPSPEKEIR